MKVYTLPASAISRAILMGIIGKPKWRKRQGRMETECVFPDGSGTITARDFEQAREITWEAAEQMYPEQAEVLRYFEREGLPEALEITED